MSIMKKRFMVMVLGCLFMVSCIGLLRAEVDSSLAGYWSFDEGRGKIARDSSSFHNDGRIFGGAAWVKGISGSALSFDGKDDWVNCKKHDIVAGLSQMSVEVWVYPTANNKNILFAQDNAVILHLHTSANQGFHIRGEDGTRSGYLNYKRGAIKLNQWNYIVATWNGSKMKLYIDAELQGEKDFNAGSTGKLIGSTIFRIGRHFNNLNTWFEGSIDEVRIYKRALSEKEIVDNYQKFATELVVKRTYEKLAEGHIRLTPNMEKMIKIQLPEKKEFLWVLGRTESRFEQWGVGSSLQIELNKRVLDKSRSFYQKEEFTYPLSLFHYYKKFNKFRKGNVTLFGKSDWKDPDPEWMFFKQDTDFIMNNNCRGSRSPSSGLNHWYCFRIDDIVEQGVNELSLRIYGKEPIILGEIGFFNEKESKEKISAYEKKTVKITDLPLSWQDLTRIVKIPEGKPPKARVKDGYLIKDGKPFFLICLQDHLRKDMSKNVLYYNWANTIENSNLYDITGWEGYFDKDWEKHHLKARYLRKNALTAYNEDMLTSIYCTQFYRMGAPVWLAEKYPDTIALDSGGKKHSTCWWGMDERSHVNFNSPHYQQFVERVIAMIGKDFKSHPGNFCPIASEELRWRAKGEIGKLLASQDEYSKQLYRDSLRQKYVQLSLLNKEWDTAYKDWEDIQPPKTIERTANFINFQRFRAESLNGYARTAYKAFKKAFPDLPVMMERSGMQFFHDGWRAGEDRWLYTKWADIRQGPLGSRDRVSMKTAMARAEIDYYGGNKVNQACYCAPLCQYARTPDAVQFPKRMLPSLAPSITPFWTTRLPDTTDERGIKILQNRVFNTSLKYVFEGVKSFWGYSYTYTAKTHYVHAPSSMQQYGYQGSNVVKNLNPAMPKAIVEESAKELSKVNGFIYKLSPLLLPTKVNQAQVAVLYTRASSLIGFTFDSSLKSPAGKSSPFSDFYYLGDLLTHLHVPVDIVTEDTFEKLDNYKVLIAGYYATMGSQKMADRIKEFVKKGGTVIFYPEAFTYQWENTKDCLYSPGYGLDKLFGARVKNKISGKEDLSLTIVSNQLSPYLKKNDNFSIKYLVTPLETVNNGKVIATLKGTGEPIIVSGESGRAFYLGYALGLSYPTSAPKDNIYRGVIKAILEKAGVEKPIQIQNADKEFFVYRRALRGKDYWFLGLLNDYWEPQNDIKVTLQFLPSGDYDLVDVTGNKPIYIAKGKSSKALATEGITLDLKKLTGRVILIRKSGEEVWVNCPKYELKELTKEAVNIVLPHQAGKEIVNLAEKICSILSQQGTKVSIIRDNEVKTKEIKAELKEKGCNIGNFQNTVLETDVNLILIGSINTNKVVASVCQKGAYTFDKVLQPVSADFPGSGAGIIQVAESINKPYLCPTDKSREAILIGGSDEQGTIQALKRFIEIIE